jgi:hypothetical protein
LNFKLRVVVIVANQREHKVDNFFLLIVRGLEVLCEFVFEFSGGVDREYSRHGNSHSTIGVGVIGAVAVPGKERIFVLEK